MATTLQQVESATGTDKFLVLACAIDRLEEGRVLDARSSVNLDEEIATLDMKDLSSKYKVSPETMRTKICNVLGANAVIRPGKTWVIRKRKFLEYLCASESEVPS